MESDVRKFTAERRAIHRKTGAVEPFVHFRGVLTHVLAYNLERNLEISEGAARDLRQNRDGIIPR
ncbi:MAG: hypothetical protein WB680_06735 [Candidatus Acidiferrales bacterium]